MKNLDKILLVLGIIAVVYSIFSRFYGQPCVAFHQFKSSSILMLGNTLLLLAILAKK